MGVRSSVLAGLATVVILTGCSSGDDGAAGATASPASATPAAAAVTVPEPSDAARTRYLRAVRKIDAALVEDEDQAVSDGRNICLDRAQGKTAAQIERNTALRFDIQAATAKRVIAAAEKHICRN